MKLFDLFPEIFGDAIFHIYIEEPIIHIKSEIECRVYLFDEDKGIAKPGEFLDLKVRGNKQDLLFVSVEDNAVRQLSHQMSNGYNLLKLKKNSFKRISPEFISDLLLAEQGNSQAQYRIGRRYCEGDGLVGKKEVAFRWLMKSANQGMGEAYVCLGCCFQNGYSVSKNMEEAVKMYQTAAKLGVARGQRALGYCYRDGEGVELDLVEAVRWFRKAAEQGDVEAQLKLGYCYKGGNGVEKDYEKAVEWFRKAAEQGYDDAQYALGICYNLGIGVKKDLVEAVRWFRKAAEQGDAIHQYILGISYCIGEGVEQDLVEAVKWFRKAAEQGYSKAQSELGYCYERGKGIEQDYEKAVEWHRKAAEQGYSEAQFNLGVCYKEGKGVEQDLVEAVKWFRKAAEQGNANAQYNLSVCYMNGKGVVQDLEKAKIWLIKSKQQNHNGAKNKLLELQQIINNNETMSSVAKPNSISLNDKSNNIIVSSLNDIINNATKRLEDRYGWVSWNEYKKHIIDKGRGAIKKDIEADCYLAAYGKSHKQKLELLFNTYQNQIELNDKFDIIDYGCGQGLATLCFLERLSGKELSYLDKILLIDNSHFILKEAEKNVELILNQLKKTHNVDSGCSIKNVYSELPTKNRKFYYPPIPNHIKIHLFSNVLDIPEINLKSMAESIKSCGVEAIHYVLATHPGTDKIDCDAERMKEFFSMLPNGEVDDSNCGVLDNGKYWCHLLGFSKFKSTSLELPF